MAGADGDIDRDLAEPKSQAQAEKELTGSPISLGYRPGLFAGVGYGTEAGAQLNSAVLYDIERMLPHPAVESPYSYYKGGISNVDFVVKLKSGPPAAAPFIYDFFKKFWDRHLGQAQLSYDYGWLGCELSYRNGPDGLLNLSALLDFHPLDCYALTRGGRYRGVSVHGAGGGVPGVDPGGGPGGTRLRGPGRWPSKALWLVHNRRFHRFYGRSQLTAAWRPWRRLAARDGAEEVVDAAVYRHGVGDIEVRYPAEDFRRGAGVEVDAAREKAREMAESLKAGGALALPGSWNEPAGDYKWLVKRPESVLNVAPLTDHCDYLEKQVSKGVGVPPELLEASETGSGFSGRKIPLLGFYAGQLGNARYLVHALRVQCLDALVRWNFGPCEYEVEVKLVLPADMAGGEGGEGGEGGDDGKGKDKAQAPGKAPPGPGAGPEKGGPPGQMLSTEGHDVSGEKRDEKGEWAAGGGTKAGPSADVPRLKRPGIFGGLRRRAALWSLRLSRPERRALEAYVDNSGKINDAVRAEPDLGKIPGEVGEQARAIAAALERAPDLKGLQVYRGQQWYKDEPEFLRLAERAASTGGALRFAGFQSSTVDPEIAENFSSGTVLEIMTATRGAYLEHNAGRGNEQHEVLLPHNSLFRVAGVTERDYPVAGPGGKTKRLRVVRLEQVPRSGEAAYRVEDTGLRGVGLALPQRARAPAAGGGGPAELATATFDESKVHRGQPGNAGEFAPGGGGKKKPGRKAPAAGHPGAAHGSAVRVKPSKERAFDGKTPVATRTKLTKQETGRVGEAVALAYLKTVLGAADARPMNTGKTNFPIDLIEDHAPTEVKCGLVSNARKSQQWRLTFSRETPAEKAAYAKMTGEQRAAWNAEKQARIRERKEGVVADLSKEYGQAVKPRTLTLVVNPDTRTADVYEFEGFHDRIDWQGGAEKHYKGSVTYDE